MYVQFYLHANTFYTAYIFILPALFYDSAEGRHRDRIFLQDTDTFYEKYLHWLQLCSHRALIERFQLDPFMERYYAITTHSKGFEQVTIQNG